MQWLAYVRISYKTFLQTQGLRSGPPGLLIPLSGNKEPCLGTKSTGVLNQNSGESEAYEPLLLVRNIIQRSLHCFACSFYVKLNPSN